jgi:ATP-dependent RNA helicase DeaD
MSNQQQQAGFAALSLEPIWLEQLHKLGISEPTPVQQQAIPAILQGKDVIAQSQTGTGKTLAYLLPLLQRIDVTSKHLQVVILVPTRELGMQIMTVADQLTAGTSIRTQALIGGASVQRQLEKLKEHPHLTVGTPGRIAELMKLRKLSMHYVKSAVIDEVDQVFELGSAKEMELVLKGMLKTRQLLFFSATITRAIESAAEQMMNEPVSVHINPSQKTSETVEHVFYVCERREKIDTLRRLIRMYNPRSAIVFINATDDVAEVVAKLQYTGLQIEALYGEAGKQARASVMRDFRDGKFQLLLATDVAARGLDIAGVSHVFHLTPAVNAEYYLHRIGRTGRMGRSGMAVSIITPQELFIIDKFSKTLGIDIKHKAMHEGKEIDPSVLTERRREPYKGKTRNEASVSSATVIADSPKRNENTIPRPSPQDNNNQNRERKKPDQDRRSKSERQKDSKNKGAPKWLKDKQKQEGPK